MSRKKQSKSIDVQRKRLAAVIPSYKPGEETYQLIASLLSWYSQLQIVLIDDSTPIDSEAYSMVKKIRALAKVEPRLTYLRTPVNQLKAGALNFGLAYLSKQAVKPQVLFTFDDDVQVNPKTLTEMVIKLYSNRKLGAVCSQTRVINKNKNILTRLQALEYYGFTVTKIADNGLMKGPLVMQGMLTAFRMEAMKQVKGFTIGHLIEDYDITVRLKQKGWIVGIAKNAKAWTSVPEDFVSLWKQRVRWGYGGLHVVKQYGKHLSALFQDILGHTLFLTLLLLVILSFFITADTSAISPTVLYILIGMSIAQFIISFAFNIISLLAYDERDYGDWIVKLTFIPELVYSNVLSLVLLGSYMYFIYNHTMGALAKKSKLFVKPYKIGLKAFEKLGYSLSWGTRVG
jgi:cellulose synthase/poly-beta-1,6-N-acetylglucosamine synthase-like glycosyltransferase